MDPITDLSGDPGAALPGLSALIAYALNVWIKKFMAPGTTRKVLPIVVSHGIGVLAWVGAGLQGGLSLKEAGVRALLGLVQGLATSGGHSQVKAVREVTAHPPLVKG